VRILLICLSAVVIAACAGCEFSETKQKPAAPVTLDITIANGTVTPTNAQVQATKGQPIVLHVNSDANDQLHVHSVPDHTFTVEPRPGQTFEFSTDVPGRVDVELHHLNRTLATIHVQP
jgi:hypothetical protein